MPAPEPVQPDPNPSEADRPIASPIGPPIDPNARHHSAWTTRQKISRVLWSLVEATLFRPSPQPCNAWRAWLLRRFGATIGRHCVIRPTTRITVPQHLTLHDHACLGDHTIVYCLGRITLHHHASVSQYAHLCAGSHDYTRPDLPLTTEPISIGADAWIAAEAFVGPGVTIGAGCVVGARAAVFKDLPPHTVCGGNPAKPLKPRDYTPSTANR